MTTAEVSRQTGATLRELQHWVESKIIRPRAGRLGSGKRREWGNRSLFEAALLANLRAKGVPLRSCREALAQMRENRAERGWLLGMRHQEYGKRPNYGWTWFHHHTQSAEIVTALSRMDCPAVLVDLGAIGARNG